MHRSVTSILAELLHEERFDDLESGWLEFAAHLRGGNNIPARLRIIDGQLTQITGALRRQTVRQLLSPEAIGSESREFQVFNENATVVAEAERFAVAKRQPAAPSN